MSALKKRIVDLIRLEGPISVERYMALALGDPQHGYYMTRDPLGASGDFTTSPEISQMFGELIGLWCADLWLRAGQPALSLVELGPGRGTLMSDVLRATRAVTGFHDALQVTLVEMSPVLSEIQKKTLTDAHPRIEWVPTIASLPQKPTIFLANEFFDALPIRQFQKRDQAWHECLVGADDDGSLVFGLASEPMRMSGPGGTEGDVLEYAPISETIMRDLAHHLLQHNGAGLFIDYGYTASGFGDTLQAMKAHEFVNPLEAPGEADLTVHVNFDALEQAARQNGARTHGPITQAELLDRLGLTTRAETLIRKASPQQAKDIQSARDRLTEPTAKGMGQLFKALALSHPEWPTPAGF
jgi:SAM-dependent MidA family methyltransferase